MIALLLSKLSPKFWFALIVILAFTGLFVSNEVYRSKWKTAEAQVAAKQTELAKTQEDLANTQKDLKAVSDQVDLLKKATDEKTVVVAKAQEQAATLAKGNQALASKILQATATTADQCAATSQLFKDYKNQSGR